jgi:hypothetical protein
MIQWNHMILTFTLKPGEYAFIAETRSNNANTSGSLVVFDFGVDPN